MWMHARIFNSRAKPVSGPGRWGPRSRYRFERRSTSESKRGHTNLIISSEYQNCRTAPLRLMPYTGQVSVKPSVPSTSARVRQTDQYGPGRSICSDRKLPRFTLLFPQSADHPCSTSRPCRSCAGRHRADRRFLRGTSRRTWQIKWAMLPS
jgi:hypothetical protein